MKHIGKKNLQSSELHLYARIFQTFLTEDHTISPDC